MTQAGALLDEVTLSEKVAGVLLGYALRAQKAGCVFAVGRSGNDDDNTSGVLSRLLPPPAGPAAAAMMTLDERLRSEAECCDDPHTGFGMPS